MFLEACTGLENGNPHQWHRLSIKCIKSRSSLPQFFNESLKTSCCCCCCRCCCCSPFAFIFREVCYLPKFRLLVIFEYWHMPCVVPLPSNSGKWRFRLGSPTKHVIILVVTITGKGATPNIFPTEWWFQLCFMFTPFLGKWSTLTI